MLGKFSFTCGSVLSEYLGTREDRDEKYLKIIYATENISCASKLLSYVCIYCDITGTSRMLGNSVEYYSKCIECKDKPEVNRRKRKGLTESDLVKKKK